MITRLPPARPTGPFSVYMKVRPATATRSIQAFSGDGMLKLYIGAPITTMSASRNCCITCSASVASAASVLANELLRRCGTGLASRSR
ncbi:hypothetical protein G6F61_015177 [Rhizopus arrhizus]|nr:hypothetical protein G6F61_015177 [Rhizopus arrhizus]